MNSHPEAIQFSFTDFEDFSVTAKFAYPLTVVHLSLRIYLSSPAFVLTDQVPPWLSFKVLNLPLINFKFLIYISNLINEKGKKYT